MFTDHLLLPKYLKTTICSLLTGINLLVEFFHLCYFVFKTHTQKIRSVRVKLDASTHTYMSDIFLYMLMYTDICL